MEYLKGLSQVGRSIKRCDDVFLRINYLYTPILLLSMALYLSIVKSFGDPMTCWCPAHFMDSHVDYTHSYCSRVDEYYPMDIDGIPRNREIKAVAAHHMHVAMYLVYMAACCFAPVVLWWAVIGRSGLDVDAVVKEGSHDSIQSFVDRFGEYMKKDKSNIIVRCCSYCTTLYGCYLVLVFGIVKLIYIINAIVQLGRVNYFMTLSKSLQYDIGIHNGSIAALKSYGFDVAMDLTSWGANGKWMAGKETFPDQFYCSFPIRQLGNLARHSVQCFAPINELNRDIFRLVWIWFCILILINMYSLLSWLTATCRGHLTALTSRGLRASMRTGNGLQEAFLMQDGAFLLGLIEQNADKGVATQVIQAILAGQNKEGTSQSEGTVQSIPLRAQEAPPLAGQYTHDTSCDPAPPYPLMSGGDKV